MGSDAPALSAGDRRAGIFGYDRRTKFDEIADGTSNTLLMLETSRDNGPWARGGRSTVRGIDMGESPYFGTGRQFGGTHFTERSLFKRIKSKGSNLAMADGSVRFVMEDMSPTILQGLSTIAGGGNVRDDW